MNTPGHIHLRHLRHLRRLAVFGLAGFAAAAAVACADDGRIELASDQFDLAAVAPGEVFETSRLAMAAVSGYRFKGTIETGGNRVSVEGGWTAAGRTRYMIGDESGLSDDEIGNGEFLYAGPSIFTRRAGSAEWTQAQLSVILAHPPFGGGLPRLEHLEFIDRGEQNRDRDIWIRGDLASTAPIYLPGGDRGQPLVLAANSGSYTVVINKFDLLVDAIIVELEARFVEPENLASDLDLSSGTVPVASTYSLMDFNDVIEVPAAPVGRIDSGG